MVMLALAVAAAPSDGQADVMAAFRKTVITLDVPVAIPVSTPLKDRFGLGMMPALSAAVPIEPWALLGLRLRGGFLSNGPAPSDPSVKDPGTGGLGALLVTARLRPLAKDQQPLATGPWLEVGVGPGLTGSLVRVAGEAGLGWTIGLPGFAVGPTARFLNILQTSDALDDSDARILLFGLEIVLRDPQRKKDPEQQAEPAQAKTEEPVAQDRDGDGIPDDVDKCPDDPEDQDGFQDGDGCPDPDNDQDGIPDGTDKCPNQPETINGFQDEDGCPDDGPVQMKSDRILLKERLLFDTNRARVKGEGQPALAAILKLWRRHPEWDHLIVDGHADRHGSDQYNRWLSHERALRVRGMLIEMGFPAEKLTLRAFGRSNPRVPDETEEADRENRRVEFVIVKKGQATAASTSAPAAAVVAEPVRAAASPEPAPQTQAPIEPPAQATAPLEPPPLDPDEEAAP